MVMTTERALYRAICRSPDDDLPRLAYADLMEEEGDPLRAAFIRTQLELARVPSYDPLYVSCQRHDPGAINGWAMAHTLPTLPPGFEWSSFRFERGFPSLARVVSPEAFKGDPFDAAPIHSLDFAAHGPDVISTLAAWPRLAGVRRLEFQGNWLSADDVQRLVESSYAQGLTEWRFEDGGVSPDGLRVLAGSELFRKATSLEVRASLMPPGLLFDALGEVLPTPAAPLRRLSLASNKLSRGVSSNLFHLFKMSVSFGLECLDIAENGIGYSLHALPGFVERGVACLDLSNSRPRPDDVRVFTDRAEMANLRAVNLSASRLGPTAIKVLALSPHLRGLLALDLGRNPVGDSGAKALAESPHLGNLLRLDLRGSTRPFRAATRRLLRERFGDRVVLDGEVV